MLDKKRRDQLTKITQDNDQIREEMLEVVKQCYQENARKSEFLRKQVSAKYREQSPMEGIMQDFATLERFAVALGLMVIQEKLFEWMDAGAIPQGEGE